MRIVACMNYTNKEDTIKTVNSLYSISNIDEIYVVQDKIVTLYELEGKCKTVKYRNSSKSSIFSILEYECEKSYIWNVKAGIIYKDDMLEYLLTYTYRYRNCAIGTEGYKFGIFPFYLCSDRIWHKLPNESKVDVLSGNEGVLYRRSFFNYERQPIIRNKEYEDLYISAYLCDRNIPRIYVKPFEYSTSSLRNTIYYFHRRNLFTKKEPIQLHNTLTGPFIILFGLIILIVLIYLYLSREAPFLK